MKKVYVDKKSCCGCGICLAVCSKHAITMQEDEMGYVYPVINQELCVNCGLCSKICVFNKNREENSFECYAGMNMDDNELMKSTSGGIFSGVANEFLKDGLVCGVASFFDQGIVNVQHILIDNVNDLEMLQGSKYVQSSMWMCLEDMKSALAQGKKVLFSGTPCQVDGVKSLFRKYLGVQLFTIDIICHGVPNQKIFNDYLKEYQNKHEIVLTKFDFRNKKYGWGRAGVAQGEDFESKVTTENSSYYRYFLDGEIHRDNCYNCSYACKNRVGDITIGDYWGVERYDSQLLDINGGKFSKEKGISCIFVNSEAGKQLLNDYGAKIFMTPIDVENALVVNTQLRESPKFSNKRKKILSVYQKKGYQGVETLFKKQIMLERIKRGIKRFIPESMKRIIKKILGKDN